MKVIADKPRSDIVNLKDCDESLTYVLKGDRHVGIITREHYGDGSFRAVCIDQEVTC